jgi:hypothetical protein
VGGGASVGVDQNLSNPDGIVENGREMDHLEAEQRKASANRSLISEIVASAATICF